MGVKAIDVANFFINEFKDTEDPMTKTRIQKFMYYAQAQCMVRLGYPLFDEDFEAWKFGPVIPEVSTIFMSKADGDPITETIGKFDIHVFKPSELEILMDVSAYCGRFSTSALSNNTHVTNGPWDQVHKEKGRPQIIKKDSIKDYYAVNEPIPSVIENAINNLPKEGRIDEKGRLILPADSDW